MSRRQVEQRLRSARGHLDAVLRMVEEERHCLDVLHQLGAVQAAIERTKRAVLEEHLRTCVQEAYAAGQVTDLAGEMLDAVFGGRPSSTRHCGAAREGLPVAVPSKKRAGVDALPARVRAS
jgi:DNA-binding FrmR family transcriptional regulator